jgi:predicted RNA methylase
MARRQTDGTIKIDDRVLDILGRFRCSGNVAHRHEETLDRKDYEALNRILEALGGKWTRASKALPGGGHVFPEGTDAAELVEAAILTGSVADPKVGDAFWTPAPLARRMAEQLGEVDGKLVLEPSAGLGAIATAARMAGGRVTCVERDASRSARLRELGFAVHTGDFLEVDPSWVGVHDVVLMNPPFSREQDARHVAHALRFARPGGRLVAVTGPGWRFRTTRRAEAFRRLMDAAGAEVEELPAGTFKESGTMVRSLLVRIDVTERTRAHAATAVEA